MAACQRRAAGRPAPVPAAVRAFPATFRALLAAFRALLPTVPALLALGACAVTQELHLRADRSGETTIAIGFSADLVARVQEMAELTGSEMPEEGVINLEPIHNRLSARPGVTVDRVEAPEEHRVEVAFAFDDAQAILPNPGAPAAPGIVTVDEVEDGTRVRFYFDLANYGLLAEVFPMLADPAIRAMGPEENTEITEDDYLAMMGFILGPAGPEAIADSLITIRVTVDGEPVSQRGGRVDGGAVVFEVPLIDLLLLHEPIDLEVVFR